jgi:hypothetical protein
VSCQYLFDSEFPGEIIVKDDDFDEDPEEPQKFVQR